MHLLIPSIINYVPQRLETKTKAESIIGNAEQNRTKTKTVNIRTKQNNIRNSRTGHKN
jgi:hypothetical protein